jgi:hypothetical protein
VIRKTRPARLGMSFLGLYEVVDIVCAGILETVVVVFEWLIRSVALSCVLWNVEMRSY